MTSSSIGRQQYGSDLARVFRSYFIAVPVLMVVLAATGLVQPITSQKSPGSEHEIVPDPVITHPSAPIPPDTAPGPVAEEPKIYSSAPDNQPGSGTVGGAVGAGVGAATGGVYPTGIFGRIFGMQERPRFHDWVKEQGFPSDTYSRPLRVGVIMPRKGVTYYAIPESYRGAGDRYRYARVNDRTVVVDTHTRKVVDIID